MYNTRKRSLQLQQLSSDAWFALSELHNQEEVLSDQKKKIKEMMREIEKMEEQYIKQVKEGQHVK